MTAPPSTLAAAAASPWYRNLNDPGLVLYRDWDYFASMAASLRSYLSEYGTIPLWNFQLCGGKPELANPQSWAFTWPSAFAYLLPPYPALLALWLAMTTLGVWATGRLFRKLGACSWGAWTGAVLYAANGLFAARFNQGHVSSSVFHLVPLLLLSWCNAVDPAGGSRRGWLAVHFLTTFALMSGGLPSTLFYFYPAFGLLVLVSAVVAVRRRRRGIARLAAPIAVHCLGIVAAMYKLLPVAEWQIAAPRGGVTTEYQTPAQVFANTLRFATDYDQWNTHAYVNQIWPAWEYDAFAGPLPWVMAGVYVLYRWRARRRPGPGNRTEGDNALLAFGLLLITAGTAMACGNGSAFAPPHYFVGLPLLGGIRVFSRYQILVLFGLAALTSLGVSAVERMKPNLPLMAKCCLSVLLCGPGLWQVWRVNADIPWRSGEELASSYRLPDRPAVPQLVQQERHFRRGTTFECTTQMFLIDRGYFVANCYEPMTTAKFELVGVTTADLAEPAPTAVELNSSGIRLRFADSAALIGDGVVRVPLPSLHKASFNIDTVRRTRYGIAFDARQLPAEGLVATMPTDGLAVGLALTCTAWLAAALLWVAAGRRRRT